jgi:hypothetical protein
LHVVFANIAFRIAFTFTFITTLFIIVGIIISIIGIASTFTITAATTTTTTTIGSTSIFNAGPRPENSRRHRRHDKRDTWPRRHDCERSGWV